MIYGHKVSHLCLQNPNELLHILILPSNCWGSHPKEIGDVRPFLEMLCHFLEMLRGQAGEQS